MTLTFIGNPVFTLISLGVTLARDKNASFIFEKIVIYAGEFTSLARNAVHSRMWLWLRCDDEETLLWPRSTLFINHSLVGGSKTVGRLIHRPRRADILCTSFWRLSSTRLISPFSLGSFPTFIAAFAPSLSLSLVLFLFFSLLSFNSELVRATNAMLFSRNLSQSDVTNSTAKRPYTAKVLPLSQLKKRIHDCAIDATLGWQTARQPAEKVYLLGLRL